MNQYVRTPVEAAAARKRILILLVLASLAIAQLASFKYFLSNSKHFSYDTRQRQLEKHGLSGELSHADFPMSANGKGRYLLLTGWSPPDGDASCVWSKSKHMDLYLPVPPMDPRPHRVQLTLQPFLGGREGVLPIEITAGQSKQSFSLSGDMNTWTVEFDSPRTTEASRYRTISIDVPRPVSPFQLRQSRDARKLGVCIHRVRVLP
jgi:hypothetical protein